MPRYRVPHQAGRPASDSLGAALQEVRSAFRSISANEAEISALLALYGSITSLSARCKRIVAILKSHSKDSRVDTVSLDDLQPGEVQQFSGFYEELLDFGDYMSSVSLAVIDIFYPGLKTDLLNAVGLDVEFADIYTRDIAPKYALPDRVLPVTLVQILDKFSTLSGADNVGRKLMREFGRTPDVHRNDMFVDVDIPTGVSVEAVLRIAALLEECRKAIRDIVRDNWDFRDLVDGRSEQVHIEGGIHVANAEYNVDRSQVGAMGPDAHVHDVSFEQRFEQEASSFDLKALAEQLDVLQNELAKQATERDHYAAIVAVSDAAASARQNKGGDAFAKLRAAGKWALEVATKIGVPVATEALKVAIGIA